MRVLHRICALRSSPASLDMLDLADHRSGVVRVVLPRAEREGGPAREAHRQSETFPIPITCRCAWTRASGPALTRSPAQSGVTYTRHALRTNSSCTYWADATRTRPLARRLSRLCHHRDPGNLLCRRSAGKQGLPSFTLFSPRPKVSRLSLAGRGLRSGPSRHLLQSQAARAFPFPLSRVCMSRTRW